MEFIQNFDNSVLQFIQSHLRSGLMDNFFVFITKLGDGGFIWLVLAIVLLFFKKTRKCGILVIITVAIGFITGDRILKNIISRDRPFISHPLFPVSELLIKPPSGYSFPSGHTASSFGAATAILLYNKKFGIIALFMAVLIAFSRMYLYVHFPSDILGGIILGVGVCLLCKVFLDYFYKKTKIGSRI